MVSVRLAFVALALLLAPVARADSDGVPSISGEWRGKITARYWDQTNDAALHPKLRYRDRIDVVVDQIDEDLEMNVTFEDGMPAMTDLVLLNAVLEGYVGNYHLSVARVQDEPHIVGSGQINRRGNRIKIRGTAASADFTMEFLIHLKKTGD